MLKARIRRETEGKSSFTRTDYPSREPPLGAQGHRRGREDGKTGGRVGPYESGGDRVARATTSRRFLPDPSVYFLAAISLGAITCLDDGSDGVRTRAHTKVEEEDLIVDVGGPLGALGACIRRPWICIRRPRGGMQRGGYVMVAAGGIRRGYAIGDL